MFQKLFVLLAVCFCGCATTAKFDYRQNDMYMRGTTDQANGVINMAADAELKRAQAYAIRQCAEDKQCLRKQQEDKTDEDDALAEAAEAGMKAKEDARKEKTEK